MKNKNRIGIIGNPNTGSSFIQKSKIRHEIEMFDSLVEFPHGREHCILPEHYDQLADCIYNILNPR